MYRTKRARRAPEAAFATAHHLDDELRDLLGPKRLEALKQDLVRIVESRGHEVTELPRPDHGRRQG